MLLENGQCALAPDPAMTATNLHVFLGSKKDFSSWIKNRIQKYGLIDNQDYSRFTQKGEREIRDTQFTLKIKCHDVY